MIAAIEPGLRPLLSDDTIVAIDETVAHGVTCMVCAGWMGPEHDGHASAVALRRTADGDTLIRFAHEACSPSRLIEVDELPELSPPPRPRASAELEWALTVRASVLPMVVLVWDLERIEQLDVTGRALLESLRLDGLSGGQAVDTIKPSPLASGSVQRHGFTLEIITRHGNERLALGDAEAARAALHLAAHQQQLLLVVGQNLGLGGQDLDEVDRQLQYGDAVAGVVAYRDPELASIPLRGGRVRRIGRGLLGLMPSERRRRRRRRAELSSGDWTT